MSQPLYSHWHFIQLIVLAEGWWEGVILHRNSCSQHLYSTLQETSFPDLLAYYFQIQPVSSSYLTFNYNGNCFSSASHLPVWVTCHFIKSVPKVALKKGNISSLWRVSLEYMHDITGFFCQKSSCGASITVQIWSVFQKLHAKDLFDSSWCFWEIAPTLAGRA